MSKQYKILAIDPAQQLGWSVNTVPKPTYGLENYKLRRDESFGYKLIQFKTFLKRVCEAEKINFIVFERPSGRNSAALMSHAKFISVIEIYCGENEIPYRGYSAKEIKSFATGNGNAGKPLMIKKAICNYKLPIKDDNIADALHLLHLAIKDIV